MKIKFQYKMMFAAVLAAGLVGACGSDDSSSGGSTTTCNNNNKKEGTEACDGTDLGTATCATATSNAKPGGTLKCTQSCTFDTTLCTPGGGTGGSGS